MKQQSVHNQYCMTGSVNTILWAYKFPFLSTAVAGNGEGVFQKMWEEEKGHTADEEK